MDGDRGGKGVCGEKDGRRGCGMKNGGGLWRERKKDCVVRGEREIEKKMECVARDKEGGAFGETESGCMERGREGVFHERVR